MAPDARMVTCTAPVNIALIKYWGKRDEKLILPVASSLSVTLGQDEMCAKTTVALSKKFNKDQFWLNNEEQAIDNPRLLACLNEIRKRSSLPNEILKESHLRICSENNFPTAAGLASSAAGYACLVAALAKLFQVEGDISGLARRGSGSACRSVYGGFVEWICGESEDGGDSIARPVAPASHWPELRILVLVVSDRQKPIGSTEAMQQSIRTSDFLRCWAKECVPKQIVAIKKAIAKKDFPTLADLTMKASTQLHAICLETFPPVVYMNDISHAIVQLAHQYNSICGQTCVAYTFDAGPNACLLLESHHVQPFVGLVNYFFPKPNDISETDYIKGLPVNPSDSATLKNFTEQMKCRVHPGSLKYIIHTKVGEGPREVSDHLLDENGTPNFNKKL